jgi:hypothetical protein
MRVMGPRFVWNGVGWLLAVSVGVVACQQQREPLQQKPSWFYATKIAAKEAKRAFGNNTEVLVDIKNKTDEAVLIQGLDANGAVVLVYEGGQQAKLHRVSVGVAKPIVVPPRGSRSTSLLFEARNGAPRQLRVYGQDYAIP